jgi:hypothetical protein
MNGELRSELKSSIDQGQRNCIGSSVRLHADRRPMSERRTPRGRVRAAGGRDGDTGHQAGQVAESRSRP